MTGAPGQDPVIEALVTVTRLTSGVPERVTRARLRLLVARGDEVSGQPPDDAHRILERLRELAARSESPTVRHSADRAIAAAAEHLDGGGDAPGRAQLAALASLLGDIRLQVVRRSARPPDVHLPEHLPPRQLASWRALVEVADRHPGGWSLIGGQMVALHCWERGAAPSRPTNDGDAVLDVRASPEVLRTFTQALVELGFRVGEPTATGHEHRWHRPGDEAQIDVLIPDGVGGRAADRRGAGGGTTLTTPGAHDALRQSRVVWVHLDGQVAEVRRPHLPAALLLKGRAARVPLDPGRARHLLDAAILLGLLSREDRADLHHLLWQRDQRDIAQRLVDDLTANPLAWATERQQAERGIAVLEGVLRST